MVRGVFLQRLLNGKRSRRVIVDFRMASFVTSSEEVALSV